jgi:hypothetical protein
MTSLTLLGRKRSTAGIATIFGMVALSASFGWMMILDIRLYGELPDDALGVVMGVLVAATIVSALPWRWAATVGGLVAAGSTMGSLAEPFTRLRLTEPETAALGVANFLILACGVVAAVAGAMATVEAVRARRAAVADGRRE